MGKGTQLLEMSNQKDKEDIIDLCDDDEEDVDMEEEEVAFVRVIRPPTLNLHRAPPRAPEVHQRAESARSHGEHMVQPREHMEQQHRVAPGHTHSARAGANAEAVRRGRAAITGPKKAPPPKEKPIASKDESPYATYISSRKKPPLQTAEGCEDEETRKPTVEEKLQEKNDRKLAEQMSSSRLGAAAEPSMVAFEVKGVPKTKERHKRAKAGHYFNPSARDEKSFRTSAEEIINRVYGGIHMFGRKTPLRVEIQFRFSMSVFNLQRIPDIDNLSKLVLDALNRLLYHDDRQVVYLVAEKGITTSLTSSTVVVIKATSITIWNEFSLAGLDRNTAFASRHP